MYFNFQLLREQSRRQEGLDWIIIWISCFKSTFYFLLNRILFFNKESKYLKVFTFSRNYWSFGAYDICFGHLPGFIPSVCGFSKVCSTFRSTWQNLFCHLPDFIPSAYKSSKSSSTFRWIWQNLFWAPTRFHPSSIWVSKALSNFRFIWQNLFCALTGFHPTNVRVFRGFVDILEWNKRRSRVVLIRITLRLSTV